MANLFSEIVVFICFISLIFVLFDEKKDYLFYSVLIVIIAGLASALGIEEARYLEEYVDAIHWDVIFFLIAMFTIVEILQESKIFHYIAKKLVDKYSNNIRKMFWMICFISTISASFTNDLSMAIIFIPIIIETCKEIGTSPKPFLLGMTICINLAATLTPFGSAQNVMISSYFNFTLIDFIKYIALYFVIATFATLYILDKTILTKQIKDKWVQNCEDKEQDEEAISKFANTPKLEDIPLEPKVLKKNFIALGIFIVLLVIIPNLYLTAMIGLLIFVSINPKKSKDGKERPNLSKYFTGVDYKLIYFFMCLFILVHLMELNGFITWIESQLDKITTGGTFTICLVVLLLSSLLSGLIDNAPVTILFLPVVGSIIGLDSSIPIDPSVSIPIITALILGVNLGGNFLPQGSAADLYTLEMANEYCVPDLNYKVLTKIGGLFALLHIIMGIGYIALIIFVFPI